MRTGSHDRIQIQRLDCAHGTLPGALGAEAAAQEGGVQSATFECVSSSTLRAVTLKDAYAQINCVMWRSRARFSRSSCTRTLRPAAPSNRTVARTGTVFGDASRFPFSRFFLGGTQWGEPLRGYEESTVTPFGIFERDAPGVTPSNRYRLLSAGRLEQIARGRHVFRVRESRAGTPPGAGLPPPP